MNSFVKKTVNVGILFTLSSIIICLTACGSGNPAAKNAQEFVQKYSQAYSNENADLIVKMTSLGKDQTEEALKEDVKKDIKSRGFGYRAWTNTSYVSEVDHDRYIKVSVAVKAVRSSIVLLKQEGTLKLALNPSDYE